MVFLTCDEELLGEGAAVEGCDLLLQTHSQDAGGQRHGDTETRRQETTVSMRPSLCSCERWDLLFAAVELVDGRFELDGLDHLPRAQRVQVSTAVGGVGSEREAPGQVPGTHRLSSSQGPQGFSAAGIPAMVSVILLVFSAAPWRSGAVFISTMPHLSPPPSEGLHNERSEVKGRGKRLVMQHV